MLLEPPTHTENAPAPTCATIPHDLDALARRARRDPGARRELADALLVRRWTPDLVSSTLGMSFESVSALATVRRPGTDAAHVAAELVPHPRTA